MKKNRTGGCRLVMSRMLTEVVISSLFSLATFKVLPELPCYSPWCFLCEIYSFLERVWENHSLSAEFSFKCKLADGRVDYKVSVIVDCPFEELLIRTYADLSQPNGTIENLVVTIWFE
jgi:hypothetical protein